VYCAPMVTRGGAISGYCSSGSVKIDSAPANMMTMAMTHAKMGRLIKNCAMNCDLQFLLGGSNSTQCSRSCLGIDRFLRGALTQVHLLGMDLVARLDALKTVHHHALTGLQAAVEQPVHPDGAAQLYSALFHRVI